MRGWLARVGPGVLLAVLAVLLVAEGMRLREWIFDVSGPVRFRWDIQNGLNQGARVLANTGIEPVQGQRIPLPAVLRAVVRTYDQVYWDSLDGRRFTLDYTPLRLLLMTLWVREVWREHGPVTEYRDEFAGMLMTINAWVGVASGLAMFLLVWHWTRRVWPAGEASSWLARHRPLLAGFVAGVLAYFNPAALINAHAFPQWDTWLLPFFLLACYCGSRRWWFMAGLLLVLGSFFKGQVLLVSLVLLLWPLLLGNPAGMLKMAAGGALAVAAVVWPWLARHAEAWVWVGAAVAAVIGLAAAGMLLRRLVRRALPRRSLLGLAAVVAGAIAAYPALPASFPPDSAPPVWWLAVVAAGTVLVVACGLRATWRHLPTLALGTAAAAVILGGWRFDGSWSWYEIGYEFPTRNFQAMAMGPTANLPALLHTRYGWGLRDATITLPGFDAPLTMQKLMRIVFVLSLMIPAVLLAWHTRRSSATVLTCLTAPWVLMFALLPQMHERYLVWAAVVSAAPAVLGGLPALTLHLATTFFAFAFIAAQILSQNPGHAPGWYVMFTRMIPDAGWAVLLLAAAYAAACFPALRGRLAEAASPASPAPLGAPAATASPDSPGSAGPAAGSPSSGTSSPLAASPVTVPAGTASAASPATVPTAARPTARDAAS